MSRAGFTASFATTVDQTRAVLLLLVLSVLVLVVLAFVRVGRVIRRNCVCVLPTYARQR